MFGLLAVFLGCVGQATFWPVPASSWGRYGQIAFFIAPFVALFVLNLCNVSLVSFKTHLRIYALAMIWWSVVTVVTEALFLAGVLETIEPSFSVLGHVLMHVGWIGFVPLAALRKSALTARSET